MILGSNQKQLIAHKMSLILMPVGTASIANGIKALSDPNRLVSAAREAQAWVAQAISVVKTAPDNPFKDDEAIAGEIMRMVREKQGRKYERQNPR